MHVFFFDAALALKVSGSLLGRISPTFAGADIGHFSPTAATERLLWQMPASIVFFLFFRSLKTKRVDVGTCVIIFCAVKLFYRRGFNGEYAFFICVIVHAFFFIGSYSIVFLSIVIGALW